MFNLSWKDLGAGTNPWTALASGTLLVQAYQSILTRLGYIALLFYWYLFISKDWSLYSQIIFELLRSKKGKGGETDEFGKHWTLNIVDHVVLAVFNWVFRSLIPGYFWTHVGLGVFLSLIVLRNHVVQLWMQTQIANLIRLNTNVWRWRDWIIDRTCLSLMQKFHHPTIGVLATAFWWAFYQIDGLLTSEVLVRQVWGFFVLQLIYPKSPYIKSWTTWSKNLLFYRFWCRGLGKFANPNPPEYKYDPLQDPENIRLVLLYPRFGFGKVCCSLVQGPHMRTLFYEAISYTWGTMDATEEILVDGCRMKVTRSAYEILTSYSSLFLPKLLWIDALCIDQKNDAEKSQQVPLMEKIYRNAIFTTVFLGRSPLNGDQSIPSASPFPYRYDGLRSPDEKTKSYFDDTGLTFDLLKEFHILEGNALQGQDMETYQHFENLRLSPSKRRQWAALLQMLQHPWFERVWVVQEAALSAEVIVRYGDETIDWDTLAEGVQKLNHARHFRLWLELEHGVQLGNVQNTSLYNIARIHQFRKEYKPTAWNDWNRYPRSFDLAKVLAIGAYFKAKNPRDLIFGLMSLCAKPLETNYALSVGDVYLNAAKRLIDDGAIHLLFHTAGIGNRKEIADTALRLPSWVPEWTTTPRYERLQNAKNFYTDVEFEAGGWSSKPIISLKTDKSLSILGHYVDVIEEIGPALFDTTAQSTVGTLDEMHNLAVNFDACQNLLESSHHTSDPYPHTTTQQSLLEAFHRALFTDRAWINWTISQENFLEVFPKWERALSAFRSPISPTQLAEEKDLIYKLLKLMNEITETIKTCCGGRRMFITKKGYIGFCPPFARTGDLVYVVPGVHAPILLRRGSTIFVGRELSYIPAVDLAKRHRLVGECYVHGLMNGEGLGMGWRKELEIT